MPTLTQVFNTSLSHAGVAKIEDAEEDSAQAIACRTHFEPLYQALTELAEWPWAVRRKLITAEFIQPNGAFRFEDDLIVPYTPNTPEFDYRYELPANHYPYTVETEPTGELANTKVRPWSIVESLTSDDPEDVGPAPRWKQEDKYLLTDYFKEAKPPPADGSSSRQFTRQQWRPTLILRYGATVDVSYAKGPFVECLQALLGAMLVRKFQRQASLEQSLLAYAQTQLQLAFRALPEPIDYGSITFYSVQDVLPPGTPQ